MNSMTERQLEDYICEYPIDVCGYLDAGIEVIGRQVVVRHGIIDLLAYTELWQDTHNPGLPRLLVIELKARPLQEKDVGQLLRYINDTRELVIQDAIDCHYLLEYCPEGGKEISAPRMFHFQEATDVLDEHDYMFQKVTGILIGSEVCTKVLAACDAAEIDVVVYHNDCGKLLFDSVRLRHTEQPIPTAIKEFNRRRAMRGLEASNKEFDVELDGLFFGKESEQ